MKNLFVNSVPKSGTNLLSKYIDMLGYKYKNASLNPRSSIGNIFKTVARYPYLTIPDKRITLKYEVCSSVRSSYVSRKLTKNSYPYYITGHCSYCTKLDQLLYDSHFNQVFVYRDPRDVILSYAHYALTCKDHLFYNQFKSFNLVDVIRILINGSDSYRYPILPFSQAYSNSMQWVNLAKSNFLPIRFEDLVGSKGGGDDEKMRDQLTKIGSFLDIKDIPPLTTFASVYGASHTFRSGLIFGWRKTDDLILDELSKLQTLAYKYGYF